MRERNRSQDNKKVAHMEESLKLQGNMKKSSWSLMLFEINDDTCNCVPYLWWSNYSIPGPVANDRWFKYMYIRYIYLFLLCKQILYIYWLVVNTINIASMTFKTSYSPPCIFFGGDRFLSSKGSVPGVLVDVKVRAEMIPCESGAIFRWLQKARLKLGELGLGWSRCIKSKWAF